MLNIDEGRLKLLLEEKRRVIEKRKYSGIGEIISGVSLAITLFLTDFSNLTIIDPLYFKIIVWFITSTILIYGIYTLLKSITGFYSVDNLYNEIADLDSKTEHPFNIVLIMNNSKSGKYLVFKSKRWSCWLFPNYHCSESLFNQENEEKYIKNCLKRDLNTSGEISIKYIGNEISKKYSVGDKVTKKYNFHYFQVSDIIINSNNRRAFRYKGKRYSWKTLDQMYLSKNIVKKNKDVLDYVRKKCDLS